MENTTCIKTRIDLRKMASIALWAKSEGISLTTRSEIVRMVFNAFYDYLLGLGVKHIDTYTEAMEVFAFLGIKITDPDKPHMLPKMMLQEDKKVAGMLLGGEMRRLAEKIAYELDGSTLSGVPSMQQSAEAYELASQQEVAMFDSGMSNINQMTQEEKDKLIDELMKAQEAQRQVE